MATTTWRRRAAGSRWEGSPPVLLTIAGDSAAGKTTLARGIAEVLGTERVTGVCTDDYHRYDRKTRAEMRITPLHPECNYVDIVEQHLTLLSAGQPILKPVYDHSTGTFAAPVYLEPREFVVVEGLLPLFTPAMRSCAAVRVYLDPEEELRRGWKLKRDCTKRGYEPEQVLAELKRREPDVVAFIRPQRAHADIVVRFHKEPSNGNLSARLYLRPTLSHPDLDVLAALAAGSGTRPIRLRLDRHEGRPVDVLEVEGDCPPEAAAEFEEALWKKMAPGGELRRNRIGVFTDGSEERRSETLALAQLLIVYQLAGAHGRA